MSQINARSTDVLKLAGALKRYQQDQKQVTKQVSSAISSANWQDKKKEEFEARFKDHSRQLERFVTSQVDEMVKSLNELARKLQDIEQMKM